MSQQVAALKWVCFGLVCDAGSRWANSFSNYQHEPMASVRSGLLSGHTKVMSSNCWRLTSSTSDTLGISISQPASACGQSPAHGLLGANQIRYASRTLATFVASARVLPRRWRDTAGSSGSTTCASRCDLLAELNPLNGLSGSCQVATVASERDPIPSESQSQSTGGYHLGAKLFSSFKLERVPSNVATIGTGLGRWLVSSKRQTH